VEKAKLPGILVMLKNAAMHIFEDDIFTLAGAVAFFATLSIAPLMVILLSVTGLFSASFHQEIVAELELLLGPAASGVIDVILTNIEQQELAGRISAVISVVILIFSSTAVFVQLQKAMNKIWGVRTKPSRAVRNWFKKRLVSIIIILGMGLILVASVLLKTALGLIFGDMGDLISLLSTMGNILIYFILFGVMLIYVPDAKLAWRDIGVGALITALFFHFGKWLIGRYLSFSGIGSAYGAAGTLVVGLLWVYYSTLVIFLGTELAKAYALSHGDRVKQE